MNENNVNEYEKDFHQISVKETLMKLKVTKECGLRDADVKELRIRYGENEIDTPETESLLDKVVNSIKEPMMMILLIAAIISFFIGQTGDGIGILSAIFIGVAIGIIVEGRSKRAADELKKACGNIQVKVLRDKNIKIVNSKELVPGDIVVLQSGDKVPADGRLLESVYMKLDESMLTGESKSVLKDEKLILEVNNTIPADKKNMLFSGTLVTEGSGVMAVASTGNNTEMGQVSKNLKEDDIDTPLQQKLGNLGAAISKISSIMALILFIYMVYKKWPQINVDTSSVRSFLKSIEPIKDSFVVCIALIVAAVPEGLPTMINMTLALTMRRMAKINALVRKKDACETIGSVSVICSDKTGTLTQNEMTVVDAFIGDQYVCLAKSQDSAKAEKWSEGLSVLSSYFIENCALNSTANLEIKDAGISFIGNTTECSLLKYLSSRGTDYKNTRTASNVVRQFEFTSKKKRMSTLVRKSNGYVFYTKGAPEIILEACKYININEKVLELNMWMKKQIKQEIKRLQKEAKRVIAFSYKDINNGINITSKMDEQIDEMVFTGFVGIEDPLRGDVKEAIAKAKRAGVETKILTGDNIDTATAIANQLRILSANKKAVTSREIDAMDEATLIKEIDDIGVVARSTPETKMRIVKALKAKNHVVAVTGDGINDAPALVKSDVGISMGITGTDVAQEASDIILKDDSFATIIKGLKWGRGIYENFQRFIQFQITVNIVAFLTAILSIVLNFKFPFTTIQLLWINIIMDGPPALSLGLEPVRDKVLKRKPINRTKSIITQGMLQSMLFNAFIMVTGILIVSNNPALIAGRELKLTAAGNSFDDKLCGAILFSTFAFFALWNAFNCREFGKDSIIPNFFKNKFALKIISATVIIQILIVQFASEFFNTVPLEFLMWARIVIYTFSVVVINEVIKFAKRLFVSYNNKSDSVVIAKP